MACDKFSKIAVGHVHIGVSVHMILNQMIFVWHAVFAKISSVTAIEQLVFTLWAYGCIAPITESVVVTWLSTV